MNSKNTFFKKFSYLFLLAGIYLAFVIPASVRAQDAISLSISPPIVEIMIVPGKQTEQTFSIINEGMDGYASVKVVPFTPNDEEGNVNIVDNPNFSDLAKYENWFTLTSPDLIGASPDSVGNKFFLRQGDKKNIKLRISPPAGTQEKDYYFTLLYEIIPHGVNNESTTAKIGANLLISVSKDGKPYKKARIVEFSAPKLIDSLGKLSYTLRIENTGQYFFKPTGTIGINPLFGKKEKIKIAPVNIISSTTRNVPCIKEEELIKCAYDKKVLLGFYKATASFTTDEESREYSAQTTTIALPFTIAFAISSLFLAFILIKKSTSRVDLAG